MKRADELLNKRIGKRIRTTQILRGLTQQQLGFSVGITFQQVQKYEQGKNSLSATRLIEVAKALEVSINYVLDVQDNVPTLDCQYLHIIQNLKQLEQRKPEAFIAFSKLLLVTCAN